jgi:S-adenosylmethionine:diacylglycerol 3-amino-3-carboxypropyl transferase
MNASDEAMPGSGTAWRRGRFDARRGPCQVLFGRMYEDASIELAVFAPRGRVFCIASAGCTAMKLAPTHDVVAVDINPVQLAYAEQRVAGAPSIHGVAERMMGLGRALAPGLGWRPSLVRAFLDLDDPAEQIAFWRRHLDTRRFRVAFDSLLSAAALRARYAAPMLDALPRSFGAVLRGRMERCFARHPNRSNPYARALFLGELADEAPREAQRIAWVAADAAEYLEAQPEASFDGFTLSNVLDGADAIYRARLIAAVKRAASTRAVSVLRSFAEPIDAREAERAADDRAMLWGIVDVRPAIALDSARWTSKPA